MEEKGQEKKSQEEEERIWRELNTKFANYIKLRKVVLLEDLASEFKMKMDDVISRIHSLEMNNMINGIIDERGKYIYITDSELESLYNYIKIKGKISK